jgi:hypothetical protein
MFSRGSDRPGERACRSVIGNWLPNIRDGNYGNCCRAMTMQSSATPLGLEPRMTEPKSVVLPITPRGIVLLPKECSKLSLVAKEEPSRGISFFGLVQHGGSVSH